MKCGSTCALRNAISVIKFAAFNFSISLKFRNQSLVVIKSQDIENARTNDIEIFSLPKNCKAEFAIILNHSINKNKRIIKTKYRNHFLFFAKNGIKK
jgi:hypothetical protein